VTWEKRMTLLDASQLIERFLQKRSHYPQEWNDFVDTPQRDPKVEVFRKRCYQLDPLVNRPGGPDADALRELRSIVQELKDGADRGE
jgi:hypothetical protein